MAVALVGSRTTTGGTSTSFVTTFGQTPTPGSLLLLTVASSKGTPEPTVALSGAVGATWTLLGKSWATHGAAGGGAYLYAKFATGSETAPTITASGTTTITWVMEEWSGLDSSYMPSFAAWSATIVTSASAQVLTASRTSTVDNEWVFGVLGGRVLSAGMAPPSAYGGGLAASYNTQVARTAYVYTSTAAIATSGSTLSGSVTFVNNDSTDSNTFALVAFRQPPAPVVVTGAATLVLAGTAASVEVEKSTAPSSLTLTASAASKVVFRKSGTAALALAGTGVSREVAIRAGLATLNVNGAATAVAVQRRTGLATAALTGSGTAVAAGGTKTRTGTATITLAATATVSSGSIATRTGAATVKINGTAVARVVLARTGSAAVTVNATATSTASGGVHPRNGQGFITLGATATTRTVHPRTSTASVALNQTNVTRSYVIERRAGTASLSIDATAVGNVVEWRTGSATVVLVAVGVIHSGHDVTVLSITAKTRPISITDATRNVTITPTQRPVRIESRP